jgi:hypothetical protein
MYGIDLDNSLNLMSKVIKDINRSINKRRKRNGQSKFKALKKLEITFNREENNFHPHYHIVIEDASEAEYIINAWLKAFPKAKRQSQDSIIADERSIVEMAKYAVKSGGYVDKKFREIPIEALHTIYVAVHGRKVMSPLGFKKRKYVRETEKACPTKRKDENVTWTWVQSVMDWVDLLTGEALTGFVSEAREGRTKVRDILSVT